jgi:hypothetical protein
VRGRTAIAKRQRYFGPDPFRILDDVVCPKAQDAPAFAFHCAGASRVCLDLKGMMLAVDLDDELSGQAGEVGKVGADRVLPAELEPAEATIAKKLPNLVLGTAAVAPQVSRSFGDVFVLLQAPLT